MRLNRLVMQNFRQHASSVILFQDGITGIIGRNGAGKSTVLEAIAWALYGQKAVQRMDRGKAETIRCRRARPGEEVEVTLDFELAGQPYTVVRRPNDAAVQVGGQTLHKGTENVTKVMTSILKMDPQAFFTSFFTSQKDLSFLKDVNTRGREAYISKLLGFERLTRARDIGNAEKLSVGKQIDGLRQGLGDIEIILAEKRQSQAAVDEATQSAARAAGLQKQAEALLESARPQMEKWETLRRLSESLQNDLKVLENQINFLSREKSQVDSELAEARNAEAELEPLRPKVEEFDRLKARHEELLEAKSAYEQRKLLESQLAEEKKCLGRLAESLQELQAETSSLPELEQLIEAETKRAADLRAQRDNTYSSWQTARAEAQSGFEATENRLRELTSHIEDIQRAGPRGICPTCERPLEQEFDKVLGQMSKEVEELVVKLEQHTANLEGLKQPPAQVGHLDQEILSSSSRQQALKDQLSQIKARQQYAETEARRFRELQSRIASLEKKIDSLQSSFDPEELKRVILFGKKLKEDRDRALALTVPASRLPDLEKKRKALVSQLEAQQQAADQTRRAISEAGYSEEEYLKVKTRWEEADRKKRAADEAVLRAAGILSTEKARLDEKIRQEAAYHQRAKTLETLTSRRLHLQVATEQLDRLRSDLNRQIRPGLAQAASEFLAGMTEGRYSQIELDDDYTPLLFEDGEYKPVISGGEEDVLNLAVRLAVSQMIAERAGVDLGLLILDEVFGSLDDMRRESVVSLLHNLKGCFQQILLITHIEAIHDMVDQCIYVEYDPETSVSIVQERQSEGVQPFQMDSSLAAAVLE